VTEIPEKLGDQPPPIKLVYLVLESVDGPVIQREIADRTELDVRQVRKALQELERQNLLETTLNLEDLREKQYDVE